MSRQTSSKKHIITAQLGHHSFVLPWIAGNVSLIATKTFSTSSDTCPAVPLDPVHHSVDHNGADTRQKKDETSNCVVASSASLRKWLTGQDCGHHHERASNHNHQSSMVPADALITSQEFSTTMSLSLTSPYYSIQPQACTPESHRRQPRDQSSISCEDQTSTISQVEANILLKKSATRSPKPRTNSRESSVFLRHKQQARSAHSRQLLTSPNLPYSATLTRSFCAAHLASWDHQLLHRLEHCPVNLNLSLVPASVC